MAPALLDQQIVDDQNVDAGTEKARHGIGRRLDNRLAANIE